jgi:hypothetical protein
VVLADDVGRLQVRIRLQQGRADPAHTGQRPAAEVDARLGHARVRVEVCGERHRQLGPAALAGDVQHELLHAPGDGMRMESTPSTLTPDSSIQPVV